MHRLLAEERHMLARASAQLRSAAWACSWALVVASWGVGYGLSSLSAGTPDVGVLALSAMGAALCLPVLSDIFTRLCHCQLTRLPQRQRPPLTLFWRLIASRPFRPLPAHLIEGGEQPADEAERIWFETVRSESTVLGLMAGQLAPLQRGLRRADVVNLKLYLRLTQRQLRQGFLAV